jgi:hypothetical protein
VPIYAQDLGPIHSVCLEQRYVVKQEYRSQDQKKDHPEKVLPKKGYDKSPHAECYIER